MHGQAGTLDAALIANKDDIAAARCNLLHIRYCLFKNSIMRRNHDHRHVFVDQCNRAMLQFTGCVAFGVDVGDFFKLQRAFQSQREGCATAQIEHVGGFAEVVRDLLDGFFAFDRFCHQSGNSHQLSYKGLFTRRIQCAAQTAKGNRQTG